MMKKFLMLLTGLFLIFLVSGSANATPITLIDSISFDALDTSPNIDVLGWGNVNKLNGITDFVT